MNNKGFTLIELILVVAIIALLTLVFTPNVVTLINKNNTNTYNDTIKSVENAAKIYVSDNRYDLGITCTNNKVNISIDKLIETGDLTKMPVNPCKNQALDFTTTETVEVTYNCNTKQFSYKFRDEIAVAECK